MLQRPYLWLARKRGWFTAKIGADRRLFSHVSIPERDAAISRGDYAILTKLFAICDVERSSVFGIYADAMMLGEGIKVFYPTVEECEAMLQVSLDIPFSAYRQPFPSFAIKLPAAFVAAQAEAHGVRFPCVLTTRVMEAERIIVAKAEYGAGLDGMINLIADRPAYPTLEDAIKVRGSVRGDVREYELCEAAQRLAMNFALILTGYRTRLRFQDPGAYLAASKLLGKSERAARIAGAEKMALLTKVIEFEQEVKFFDREDREQEAVHAGGDQIGSHASPRPHWRRGHWRRQPGYRDVLAAGLVPKLTFIRPVLVNALRFVGDRSDTTTTYVAQ